MYRQLTNPLGNKTWKTWNTALTWHVSLQYQTFRQIEHKNFAWPPHPAHLYFPLSSRCGLVTAGELRCGGLVDKGTAVTIAVETCLAWTLATPGHTGLKADWDAMANTGVDGCWDRNELSTCLGSRLSCGRWLPVAFFRWSDWLRELRLLINQL